MDFGLYDDRKVVYNKLYLKKEKACDEANGGRFVCDMLVGD